MKSLYEIDNELTEAVSAAYLAAEENEGVISDELSERIDALEGDRGKKIGNICRYIKSLKAEADMVKSEADALSARAKGTTGKADSLKGYLLRFLGDGETYKDEVSKVSWRGSEGVTISDLDLIPDEYCRVERKAMATEIKKALKAGTDVSGAELYQKQNLQIK